MTKVTLGEDMV